MITCPACQEDITLLIRQDRALIKNQIPFCSETCWAEWSAEAEPREFQKVLRAAVNGWIMAILYWAVLFYGVMAANFPVGLPVVLTLTIVGGVISFAVGYYRTSHRIASPSAADILDF